MFLALYIQIILLCSGRPSKNVQIIRHRCVLPALSSPKRKAPPVGGALKCSFVAHRASRSWRRAPGVALVALVAFVAHRASRTGRRALRAPGVACRARRVRRAPCIAHRASRSSRSSRGANQRAYSSSRAAAISSVMFIVL